MSPTLGQNIGLALIDRDYAGVGKPLELILGVAPLVLNESEKY
jgi:glycine cleavage system aminomethyltransferase T